ncbi:hypothetical protein EVAR_94139_1 [Eumeta japonica]|uniref:Uncharacterized protein n=1 Tax=Eumeta variegata TaxID=151549 RepID=A0A4C1U702_EUMVA|nr:hypothetical protein EVAR_94139_1 [Eumeta japonica]
MSVKQVKEFVYLGNLFANYGKVHRDIERRANAGNKANGALLAIMHSKSVSRHAISTLIYGSESWVWQKKNESKTNVVELRVLRNICGVSLKNRCGNSDLRERCGLKADVVTRVGKGMLR